MSSEHHNLTPEQKMIKAVLRNRAYARAYYWRNVEKERARKLQSYYENREAWIRRSIQYFSGLRAAKKAIEG